MTKLFALLLCCLATPATAAATDWQQLAPGARARLITGDVLTPGGTALAGIEIEMPEATKTYWRVPGETGIPTQLDLSGSRGITAHRVLWPYPTIDHSGGFTDFVYYGHVVLPVEVSVSGEAPLLEVSLLLGICSDICVPAKAEFSLPLDFGAPDPGQGLRIKQALALAPAPWTEEQPAFDEVSFDRTSNSLSVAIADPDVDPLSVIADTGVGGSLFGTPQKSPDNSLVLLPLLGGTGIWDAGVQAVQLTFMTRSGPFEVTRQVAPSTPDGLWSRVSDRAGR